MADTSEAQSFWQTSRAGGAAIGEGASGGARQAFGKMGASTFSKSFARGGLTSRMFPVEGLDLERRGIFREGVRQWSPAYMRNLQRMEQFGGDIGKSASDVLRNAPAHAGKRMGAGRFIGGKVAGTALVAGLPALLTEGGTGERLTAAAAGIGSEIGWKAGALAGAAIGSAILPGVGTVAGAAIGAIGGGISGWVGTEHAMGVITGVAERGKATRSSNWIQDTSAFTTRRAKTMRQASLQMMNSGMMTARSGLGHEGTQLHR